MTIEERNNYICTYMGGEEYILNKHFSKKKSKSLTLNDLKFHESWDWMIPVWKKIRFDLSPTMVIFAINCIDDDLLIFYIRNENKILLMYKSYIPLLESTEPRLPFWEYMIEHPKIKKKFDEVFNPDDNLCIIGFSV